MPNLKPYVVTFNCGREIVKPDIFAAHLFNALPKPQTAPDILVLALQEVAPIAYSFLGGSYLTPYFVRFRDAVDIAAESLNDASYVNIITRNVGMTAIMVFVLRDQTAQLHRLETAGVGVGVHEMGNKGAVAVKMGYSIGDSTIEISVVSAHLAPMEDALQRRNDDWKNIVRSLVFTPISPTSLQKITAQRLPQESSHSASETSPLLSRASEEDSIPPMTGIYTPTSHLLLAGDLNYRTSLTKPTEDDPLSYPQPSEDTSYPRHYWHLFDSDQLTRELRAQRTCHGLTESPVDFPPTYKYSDRARAFVGKIDRDPDSEGMRWDWAPHRWPSWCDRVLYLDLPPWMKATDPSAKMEVQGYKALPLMPTSDHRPVACSFSIPAMAIPEPGTDAEEGGSGVRLKPPFGIDPAWKQKRAAARRKEVVVGMGAYLSLTWEGRVILLALICGGLGGWAVVVSLLEV